MNSTSVTDYKPLIEVEDFRGNFYYTDKTIAELESAMDSQDRIFFPFSNRGLRVSQIVSYGPADPEKVTLAWEIQQLTDAQKRCVEASRKTWIEYWGGTQPISPQLTKKWCEMAKKGKVQTLGR